MSTSCTSCWCCGDQPANFREDQDFKTLIQELRRKNTTDDEVLFEDQTFSTAIPDSVRGLGQIEWVRPNEVGKTQKRPLLFVGKRRERSHVNQGHLGNCYFLAALTNLAENKKCLAKVIPSGQSFHSNYFGNGYGIFRFRFWQYGQWVDSGSSGWVEVVIDDRLPTRKEGSNDLRELVFLRSKEEKEFWGALLEKAYAKLHGSYRALTGGFAAEAAVDLTGGIRQLIDMSRLRNMDNSRFYKLIEVLHLYGAFISCSALQSNATAAQGLQLNHAYTVIKVVVVKTQADDFFKRGERHSLIRLRNPQGHGQHGQGAKEWKGDWGDNSSKWSKVSERLKEKMGARFERDGEFHMSLEDFREHFEKLDICHLTAKGMEASESIIQGGINARQRTDVKFDKFEFNGEWVRGSTAGGCGQVNNGTSLAIASATYAQNPQFYFSLSDPASDSKLHICSVITTLAQYGNAGLDNQEIGFKIYQCGQNITSKLDQPYFQENLKSPVTKTSDFTNVREVTKRSLLRPGNYCIIPSTYEAGMQSKFYLRLFIEKDWTKNEPCILKPLLSHERV